MRPIKAVILGSLGIAALAALAVLLFLPPEWHGADTSFTWPFAVHVSMACLHVGAVALFAMTLGVYKAKLKLAYATIGAGILLIAAGTLQVSIVGALDAWNSPWVQRGGLVMPFLLSSLTFYLGTRYFARLIQATSILTKAWLVLPIAIGVAIAATTLPHVPTTIPEIGHNILVATSTLATCLVLAASLLVLRVKSHIGAHYQAAMAWLFLPIFVSFIILFFQLMDALVGTSTSDLFTILTEIMSIISGLLWLRAGYAFAQTKEY